MKIYRLKSTDGHLSSLLDVADTIRERARSTALIRVRNRVADYRQRLLDLYDYTDGVLPKHLRGTDWDIAFSGLNADDIDEMGLRYVSYNLYQLEQSEEEYQYIYGEKCCNIYFAPESSAGKRILVCMDGQLGDATCCDDLLRPLPDIEEYRNRMENMIYDRRALMVELYSETDFDFVDDVVRKNKKEFNACVKRVEKDEVYRITSLAKLLTPAVEGETADRHFKRLCKRADSIRKKLELNADGREGVALWE